MKRLLTVVASLLAFAAGATEIVLVEGSVAEVPSIGLAGVAYKVSYDDGTHLVTFKAKGETSASNCALIFHAVSIQDDAGKSVTGYNGNCGHTPGPTDVLMTDDGTGWLTFSIDANDYTPSLGMFLTVVLRQDNARNLERFFGICSMTAPNDWASFDGSWDNRIKIAVPTPQIKINLINTSPYLPGTANPNDASSMGKNLTLSYTITPPGFVADSANLTIKDKNGVVVYNNAITKSSGTSVAKWLVSTPSLRSINANSAPYEIKTTMTKGAYSYEDAKPLDVVTSTVTVEAEKSQTTGAPLTECMEGRKVTFTATAKGFVSEASIHKIQYVYYFAYADGTVWTVSQWALTLKDQYTVKQDKVPNGSTSHFFKTPIYVAAADTYTHSAISPLINIKVYQLWIDYFRDNALAADWKVVVGGNIAYNAISSSDCSSWVWEMPKPSLGASKWHPTGGNAKQGTTMAIPYSDLASADNSYFGNTYGMVRVSCKDEKGDSFSFKSTSMSPSQQAFVFFPRDVNVLGQPPTAANPPCWFIFWASDMNGPCSWMYKKFYKHPLGGKVGWRFSSSLDGAETLNLNSPNSTAFMTTFGPSVLTDWLSGYAYISPLYPASGGFVNFAGVLTNFPSGKISIIKAARESWKAIDKAEETARHELEHVRHWRKWANGSWVGDSDNDSLPSSFEDGFGTDYSQPNTYTAFPTAAEVMDGDDDEILCERDAGDPSISADKDWAFPGKQWQ